MSVAGKISERLSVRQYLEYSRAIPTARNIRALAEACKWRGPLSAEDIAELYDWPRKGARKFLQRLVKAGVLHQAGKSFLPVPSTAKLRAEHRRLLIVAERHYEKSDAPLATLEMGARAGIKRVPLNTLVSDLIALDRLIVISGRAPMARAFVFLADNPELIRLSRCITRGKLPLDIDYEDAAAAAPEVQGEGLARGRFLDALESAAAEGETGKMGFTDAPEAAFLMRGERKVNCRFRHSAPMSGLGSTAALCAAEGEDVAAL